MPKVYLREIDRFEDMVRDNFALVRGVDKIAETAKAMGCSKGTVSNRANDPLDLSLREIFLLCRHKGVKVVDFVGGRLELKGCGVYEKARGGTQK